MELAVMFFSAYAAGAEPVPFSTMVLATAPIIIFSLWLVVKIRTAPARDE